MSGDDMRRCLGSSFFRLNWGLGCRPNFTLSLPPAADILLGPLLPHDSHEPMTSVLSSGGPRLVAIGLCYAILTAMELVYFADSLTPIRQLGLGLQAGFAAALVYGGMVRPQRGASQSGWASSH